MSRFAALLTDLYKPLRLQARSVRPLPDEDLGFYRKFTLSLEVEGPMSELAKLLAVAARASDPIRIERMGVELQGSAGLCDGPIGSDESGHDQSTGGGFAASGEGQSGVRPRWPAGVRREVAKSAFGNSEIRPAGSRSHTNFRTRSPQCDTATDALPARRVCSRD